MRILIVSFTFPPNKDGVSEASSAVVTAYLGMGWEVDVLTLPSDEPRCSLEWRGAHIIEYQPCLSGMLDMEGTAIHPVDFIKGGGWDIVLFQTYDWFLKASLARLGEIDSAKVLCSHGYPGLVWQKMPRFPFGLGQVLRRLLRGLGMIRWLPEFDRVVYLSDYADLKGFYDHWLAKISRYSGRRIIPNGVDLNEHGKSSHGFRDRFSIPRDAFIFLCVANYSPRKDQAYAARAFRRAAIPNSRLVFIGSEINEHAEKFMSIDRSLAPRGEENHVLWLDKLDRQSTLDAFEACDSFVLSALHEAQPICLLEAMRAEKPWVARNSGCISTMEGGLCVTSIRNMAMAMKQLSTDHELCKRLAHVGRSAVEMHYNRTIYAQRYINLVKELVAEANPPRE